MATLAPGGRISVEVVAEEIERLEQGWRGHAVPAAAALATLCWRKPLSPQQLAQMDRFDRVQLADVVRVCRESPSLSEAGRELFAASRQKKSAVNDADRLRKYLARFGLDWRLIKVQQRTH